jgi:hypothetical protein
MPRIRMSHLLPADAQLFQDYLDKYPGRYTHIDYDIRVGYGRDPGDIYPPNIRTMAIHLSQRRIDAVGFRPGRIDIIEITLSGGLKALGQLNAYPQLYRQSYFPVHPLHPVLVARAFSTDAETLFDAQGIETYIIPE